MKKFISFCSQEKRKYHIIEWALTELANTLKNVFWINFSRKASWKWWSFTKLIISKSLKREIFSLLSAMSSLKQLRSKLNFSHLSEFDLIIQNLEPLSVQYAWKMESKCSYVKKKKCSIDWLKKLYRLNLHVLMINLHFALFAVCLQSQVI